MAVEKKRPLQNSAAANVGPEAAISAAPMKKSIEEVYQKKTQLEHILLRPDTYIGSIEKHTQTLWVYENDKMVNRSVTYVPGLYKIFDEILVNAADNKQRDPSMDSVKVVIDVEENSISVYNNGDGVPVEIHQEEKVYVPELIFGHLLTSSNYDDTVKKTTGGRNGYGAKLTNIFSTEFVIETADGKRQKKYKQVFSKNMGNKSEPNITKCKESENWTKVSFKPDLAKFNMTHLEDDVVALMKKRVMDLAGCLGKTVKVELNGHRVPVKSFQDYVDLYITSVGKTLIEAPKRYHAKLNDRWEVVVTLSEGQFQQVSFVNGIATIKGGTHVDCVTNQIANYVMNIVNKKNKNANVKAHNVKNYLWVFINALIDNPSFDSQTKETLTIRQSSFGSSCELPQDFLKNVTTKSGIMDSVLSWVTFKQSKDLKKTDGTKTEKLSGIEKLEDANFAGGRNSDKCTLILTEGDSAKALAMAGLGVVGRDLYGVFPLRGKLLNVREASSKQISENKEIQYIKQILGLQQGKEYKSVQALRYGHMMIMTDQDHDGSHIKGLLINFIHSFWPSLLKVSSFLVEFITPIVKATHRNGNVLSFYSMPEYESWKDSLKGTANSWSIKYYKGLGTSTSKEGREYFQDLQKHKKDFIWQDEQDGEAIELAFSKKKIEERKNWLRQFEPGTHLDQTTQLIKYSDFVNKELILFSMADLQRSIPSMVDGLKPGQRKILFCSFKRNFVKEAKVSQFSGYVSEHSAYHHGEQSLASTIIGMAQDYVGSNNINLLQPSGQFGTRNHGGKDHASSRYIFTRLSTVTRFLFPKDDDNLLNYLNEDGQFIEPTWYMPIIPLVLVNGSEGIGTGWSSYIPNYNPRDIIRNVRCLLNGEAMLPMDPWYRGFKGTIEKTATKEGGVTYTISGNMEEVNETILRITELPIRRWTNDYKEFLDSVTKVATKNDKDKDKVAKDPFIEHADHHSDDKMVLIDVHLTEEGLIIVQQEGVMKKLKLTSSISTSNMHLFDANGTIKKYDSPEQILEEFFHLRLEFYEKRKKVLLENLEMELMKLENKVRFILAVVSGEIIVSNRRKADLFLELQAKGFTPFPKKAKSGEPQVAGAIDEEADENSESPAKEPSVGDYEYLLAMQIGTLTLEKVQALCADRDKLNKEVDDLRKATPKSLWIKDLNALESELDEMEKSDAQAEEARLLARSKAKNQHIPKVARQPPKNPRKIAPKPKNSESSTDSQEVSSGFTMEIEKVAEVVKPKGKAAATKKPPVKKQQQPKLVVEEEEEDDEVAELKERLAAYNLESSPDHSADMEMEGPQAQAKKKEPSRRAAAQKKPSTKVAEISDEDGDEIDDDDDEDFGEVKAPQGAGMKEGKRPNTKTKTDKPPAAPKGASKKQPKVLSQKLLTQMLKPAAENSGISPEKKVRKMRESPFNKKSGSILGRNGGGKKVSKVNLDSDTDSSDGDASEEAIKAAAAATTAASRPQRAMRKQQQVRYVLSDSESEKASEDSDFNEED